MLIRFFLFFVFFPYLALIPTGTDLQPYAFVLGVVLLVLYRQYRWPTEIWILCIPLAVAILIAMISPSMFAAARGVATYSSPFIIAAATYTVMRINTRIVSSFIKWAAYAWLGVGLVQLFVAIDFLQPLIPNMSINPDRGVTSLATEPSFYGVVCLYLLILNQLRDPKDKQVVLILVFQIVMLAQSAIATLFLMVFMLYYLLLSASVRWLMTSIVLVVAGYYSLTVALPEESRILYLLTGFMQDPWAVMMSDVSVNARISHVLFSIYGAFDYGLLPHGYLSFSEYVKDLLASRFHEYIWLGSLDDDVKIMSGYGGALFELGIVALCFPLSITAALYRVYGTDVRRFLVVALFINTIMLAAIQISLPLFGFMIGYASFYGNPYRRVMKQKLNPLMHQWSKAVH